MKPQGRFEGYSGMRTALTLLAAVALAGCGGGDPVAVNAANTDSLPMANQETPSPTGGRPPPENMVLNGIEAGGTAIPAALHGRWGLTPADCEAPAGNSEGLLTIDGGQVRFYESVAIPASTVVTGPGSIGGDFHFTGEGQSWTKYQSIRIRDGRLVRTERNPVASFRYVRCD